MGFNLIVKPGAYADWENTIDWYNEKKDGLGFEVFQEIDEFLMEIKESPLHFQKRIGEIRVRFTPRFHFGIYYTLEEKNVFVHAILNARDDDKKIIKALL